MIFNKIFHGSILCSGAAAWAETLLLIHWQLNARNSAEVLLDLCKLHTYQ
jgi:hypothetical protein